MELTQEWITQFNKKCAEFLGSELKNDGQFDYWTYDHLGFDPMKIRGSSWVSGNFEFHSDWNWIMEVVEKIVEIPDGVGYEFKRTIEGYFHRKQSVIQAIDQFIDWYNKQKEL